MRTEPPGCWPTSVQELLLRAALGDGQPAIDAWERWRSQVDFERLDFESFRLLPLLHRNLRRLNVDHPWMGRMKGVHRRTWFTNQLLLRDAADLLRRLQSAGVRTLLLKGAVIATRHYDDIGLRPMLDLDILTPTNQAERAFQLMLAWGWTSNVLPGRLMSGRQRRQHSAVLRAESKTEVDLHFQILHRIQSTAGDEPFWSKAVKFELSGVETLALDTADQLLHVCVHGTTSLGVPRLMWIADALSILRTTPNLDWDRLLEQTRRHRVVLPMRQSLEYLERTLAAGIPADVLGRLASLKTSWSDRRRYRHATTAPDRLGPAVVVHELFQHTLASASEAGGVKGLLDMARDYQRRRDVRHVGFIPLHIAHRWTRTLLERAFQK